MMPADALAPGISKPSAAMLLTRLNGDAINSLRLSDAFMRQ